MTADEVTAELIRIAQIAAPHEVAMELQNLKTRSGVGITSLRQSLNMIIRARQEATAAERVDPIMERLVADGWFVFLENGKVWVARLAGDDRVVERLTPSDFTAWTLTLDPACDGQFSPGAMFLRNPDVPRFDGTAFEPGQPMNVGGRLNLWRGFRVAPAPDLLAAQVFERHLLRLCGGDEAAARYVADWLAACVQRPADPIGTAICFVGRPGSGKGMVGNLMARVWGQHGLALRNKKSVTGDFNEHLSQCCFAFLDEALFSGDKRTADELKGLITEPTIMVNPKYRNAYEAPNRLKIMLASNHYHALHVDPDDRRYAVIAVPDDMPGSGDPYWADFRAACYSERGMAGILHYLSGRDLSGFHAESQRPLTVGYLDQKLHSLSDDMLYWRQVSEQETLMPGERMEDHSGGDEWPASDAGGLVRKSRLYGFYARWHERVYRHGSPVIREVFFRNARALGVIEGDRRSPPSGPEDTRRERSATLASYARMEECIVARMSTRARPGGTGGSGGGGGSGQVVQGKFGSP